jgi:hypothetical protein
MGALERAQPPELALMVEGLAALRRLMEVEPKERRK